MDLNQVMLLGSVGRESEVRTANNNHRVANFTMATNKRWTDKSSGERVDRAQWHRIQVWGAMADIVEKFVHKGSRVMVIGELVTREYEKDGQKRYSTEVVLSGFSSQLIILDGREKKHANDNQAPLLTRTQPAAPAAFSGGAGPGVADDDIPF